METHSLIHGKPWKQILLFALPLMFANILQQLYSTVDTFIIGNLESQMALSAVGSCAYLVGLYLSIATGFSLGAGILISHYYGGHDETSVKKYAANGLVLLLCMGLIVTIFSLLTSPLFLKYIIVVPENIYILSYQYIMVYSLGFIFQFGYNCIASILRALGDSKSSLYFLLVASFINIIVDIIFVGVFHLGVKGVALATTLSQSLCMIVSFIYMYKKYPLFRFTRADYKINQTIMKDIIICGIPITVQSIITSCGFMFLQRLVNAFGETLIASYTVACKIECYMVVPLTSFSQAMATYAGQNLGAKKIKRIQIGVIQTVKMSLIIGSITAIVCFLCAPMIAKAFALKGQALLFCTTHIRVVACNLILFALYQPFIGMFQGVGKGKIATLMSFTELSGRLIFGYILSQIIQEAFAWYSEIPALILLVLIAYTYYFSLQWLPKNKEAVTK